MTPRGRAMGYGSGLPAFVPSLSWQCDPRIARVLTRVRKDDVVLDLGAGGRRIAPFVKTVDFVDMGDTDYVCDVRAVPLPDESVDLIVSTGLIEHVEDDIAFIEEVRRLLKPGGVVHIEAPFLQQHHDDPIDCRRFTADGLKRFLDRHGFDAEETGFHMGPSVTVATLNAYYAALLFHGPTRVHKVLSGGAFMLMSLIGWPLRYLDGWLMSKPGAERLAFGVYCTARKRGGAAPDSSSERLQ